MKQLGEILLDEGLVTESQLLAALDAQVSLGQSLGRTLVELGILTEDQLVRALAVVETLRPVQERYAVFAADPAGTAALLAKGAAKARDIAGATLARARDHLGLLPSG